MKHITTTTMLLAVALLLWPPALSLASTETIREGNHTILWPSRVKCVFAAWLYGGSDPKDFSYKPVRIEPAECTFTAYIRGKSLILEQRRLRVEIPMPTKPGWQRFHYFWGSTHAMIERRQMPVRLGPIAEY
jgi:hypothetical protein